MERCARQDLHRAGIQRIAAQLGARKPGAVEQPHARTGAREQRRRHRAAGPAHDITSSIDESDGRQCRFQCRAQAEPPLQSHGRATRTSEREFFDPKPRQLHNAAPGCAARPSLARKSRSQLRILIRQVDRRRQKPARQRQRRGRRHRPRRSRPADGRSSTWSTTRARDPRARRTPCACTSPRRHRSAGSTSRDS